MPITEYDLSVELLGQQIKWIESVKSCLVSAESMGLNRNRDDGPEMLPLVRGLPEEDVVAANVLDNKTRSILREMWQEAFDRGGSLSFRILSDSMRPMIEAGDVVKVERAEPSSVRIGDIVAFKNGQCVVVHRIIGKSLSEAGLTFREKGDAGGPSKVIEARDLIGKVTVIEKAGNEVRFDSPGHMIGNLIFGWRLLLIDTFGRMRNRQIGMVLHLTLRPVWRLCRRLLLLCL